MMTLRICIAASALFFVAAGGAVAAPGDGGRDPEVRPEAVNYSITPFSLIDEGEDTLSIPADTYTRLQITGDSAKTDRVFPYTKRKFFWRLTVGKRYTTNATLKAKAGRFVATVPLLTMDHESSSKKGESFTRGNARTSFDFPLFLVRGDGAADVGSFDFEVSASDGTTANAASLALNVAERFLKTVAPSSGVLTTLTEDETRDVASALDSAVSQLFSSSVSERQSFDINLKDGHSYTIDIVGPGTEGSLRNIEKRFGRWNVSFATPRPSIFSDFLICDPSNSKPLCKGKFEPAKQAAIADARSRPMAVLAFKLFEGEQELGTVASYLRQQTWWTDSVTAAQDTKAPAKLPELCRKIRAAIVAIGLNDTDGRIVAQSVVESDMVSGSVRDAVEKASLEISKDCIA